MLDREAGILRSGAKNTRHLHLGKPKKLAIAKHIMGTGHSVKFNTTCRLAKAKEYMDCLVTEVIEI
jgi:hypothetical protein